MKNPIIEGDSVERLKRHVLENDRNFFELFPKEDKTISIAAAFYIIVIVSLCITAIIMSS